MMRKYSAKPLTDRQRSVLEFIAMVIDTAGAPPTLREIGEEFGIRSLNGVRELLGVLEKKGYLIRKPYLSRGIVLTWRTKNLHGNRSGAVHVPIVGRVAAGMPLLAEENLEGTVMLDRDLFPSGDGFALRVKGRSMEGAGIRDGDIVLARPDLTVDAGSIAVVVIGEEATVKYFYRDHARVRLEPANPDFGPIIIEEDTPGFRVVGKVVGLFRRY